ncbi:hypothetical protein CIK05_06035 [Bdellovibrio sp. qaytius]|nr:hypothetical protein CIK05_06035 [Bdellovibrio sp. qaytius]
MKTEPQSDAKSDSNEGPSKSTNEQLVQERIRTDAVLEEHATNGEQKKLLHNLKQMRGVTDRSLLDEREKSHLESVESSNQLAAEQSAHTDTKTELTTREEFLAIVSHDLRNPIGAISSCSDMLLTEPAYQDLSKELRHWIEFMKRNADSAIRLVNDILDMERVAEGELSLSISSHSMNDLIKDILEDQHQVAAAQSILLKASLPSHPVEVVFDRDRIAQVLSNLVGNAIKFTPSGCEITVGIEDFEKEVHVFVKDNGPGIVLEKQENIFKRFAQINNKDRRGLGLGLYISKMLIELHQGQLWLNSFPGEGSTFYFSLPKSLNKLH